MRGRAKPSRPINARQAGLEDTAWCRRTACFSAFPLNADGPATILAGTCLRDASTMRRLFLPFLGRLPTAFSGPDAPRIR